MFIKKYKKSIGIFLAIVLALTALMTTAFADEADDLQKQNEEMQSQIDSEKQRLEEIKGSIGSMEEYIQVLYEEVNAIQALVDEYQRQADEKRVQIAALQTEVEKQEKELEEQYRLMEQRIVFMYENGSTDMIEAFFSAGTFGEALAKVQYVMDLTEYDRNIMNEISAAIDSINTNKAVMEQELKAIEELEAEQEVQKAVMAEAA
ncbi:MAG: hypothetical protein HUJ75_01900, partial [Parasporobacterium sp.]|nr:hypothetical protein [Parasporobacterium sp.]